MVLEESPGTQIPDNKPAGIERSMTCDVQGTLASIELSVDITHTYIGDLRVALHSPQGTQVVLHNHSGGTQNNLVKTYTLATTSGLAQFESQMMAGDWRLTIADNAGQDIGKLNTWRLQLTRDSP